MLHCVLYMFLGGTAMINSGCALQDDHVLVDKVEHVSEYAPDYPISGYKVYYSAPSVVWNSSPPRARSYYPYRTKSRYYHPRGYYGYYPKRRHRAYPRRYKPRTKKIKVYNQVPFKKSKKKKKNYRKKRHK